MDKAPSQSFILSAGAVLGFVGLAKLLSSFGDTALLKVSDPVVGIQFRELLLLVGAAELAIAAVCLLSKRPRLALVLVAWLATNFLFYRIGLWWMGWKKPCNCLGNITDALHISPQTAESIMKVLLAYLLIGSYGLLLWGWCRARGRGTEGGGQRPENTGVESVLPIAGGE